MTKKTIFIAALLLMPLILNAQERHGTQERHGVPERQKHESFTEKSHFEIDTPFYSKDEDKDDFDFKSLGLGQIISSTNDPFSFERGRSFDIFEYATVAKRMSRTWSFESGVGVEWKNLTLSGTKSAMAKLQDGSIGLIGYPDGSVPKLSRLRVFSVAFPLMFNCNFGHSYGFSLGPVVDVNCDSRINDKYTIDGKKYKDRYTRAHSNLITADLMFELNLRYIALWVKWSPTPLMDKTYWQDIQTLSFGIAL